MFDECKTPNRQFKLIFTLLAASYSNIINHTTSISEAASRSRRVRTCMCAPRHLMLKYVRSHRRIEAGVI